MDEVTILAVDPATRSGWACSDGTSGAVSFKVDNKLPGPERHGRVLYAFDRWLDGKLCETQAGVLLLERQMTHGTAAHLLLGLRGAALMCGWRRRLAVLEAWESQWKPWAQRRCPWWRKDDELDARAMLAYFLANKKVLLK